MRNNNSQKKLTYRGIKLSFSALRREAKFSQTLLIKSENRKH